ncbi:mucin-5AC-like [Mytilus californianus]|uniref:mucin-5AC-like n=1 Tax=Mytilus californianus TaxID=6549 RepID=UPI0022480162|nr:mucin-5AC-like [Mytilus californianus]
MVIKSESAPTKTKLQAIWPVLDSLSGLEDGINPTPSPLGNTGLNPTPSPTGRKHLSPTPSPTGNIGPDLTPSPSTTIELVPTPSPSGDKGPNPTPSPSGNLALTPTPSPLTPIVSNGAPTSSPTTESRSTKPTLKMTVHECSKSKVTLEVERAAEGGIIYIQGQGSACLQTTTSTSRHYEFHFDICNITYGTVFRVIVQKYPTIQTGYDKVIPVTCLVDLAEIAVIEEVLPKKDDDIGVNITTKPVANLRVYTSIKNDISGGGVVNLNDSIAMTITLADDFTDTYDIKAIECTAAMVNIIENG